MTVGGAMPKAHEQEINSDYVAYPHFSIGMSVSFLSLMTLAMVG
jgi:hypothetical protein